MNREKYEAALICLKKWKVDVDEGRIYTRQGLASNVGVRGYPIVSGKINGKRYSFKQHQIIVIAAGLYPVGFQVNHIDGNKRNNKLSNLEVVTASENIKHAIRTGLRSVGTRKLSVEQVRQIRESTETCAALAREYGVCEETIGRVKRGYYYKNVS